MIARRLISLAVATSILCALALPVDAQDKAQVCMAASIEGAHETDAWLHARHDAAPPDLHCGCVNSPMFGGLSEASLTNASGRIFSAT